MLLTIQQQTISIGCGMVGVHTGLKENIAAGFALAGMIVTLAFLILFLRGMS